MVSLRSPGGPWRVCFDGASMFNYPATTGGVPYKTMLGRGIPWSLIAVDAAPWSVLAADVTTRRNPHVGSQDASILFLIAGHTDLALDVSGAATYTAAGSYADTARTAGFDYVIGSTLTPHSVLTAPQDTQRLAFNSAILADASSKFDDVIDPAALTLAVDGSGVHWTAASATTVADQCVSPALQAILNA